MLYFISTPIGNIGDISSRAIEILSGCDFILVEDTRNTGKLLNLLGIKKKMISLHEHTNDSKIEKLVEQMKPASNYCYVSDAGTPNISDPGGKLAQKALERGVNISPIPGASSLTTLISVAPFSCSQFVFMGFFPKKKGREKMINFIKNFEMPIIFLESCHRIAKTLNFLSERLDGDGYNILLGRELTKKFEQIEYFELSDSDLINQVIAKGEFIFILAKNTKV
jgi:16S rRNA (cytidine1402-2'-O)-methyltransferase